MFFANLMLWISLGFMGLAVVIYVVAEVLDLGGE